MQSFLITAQKVRHVQRTHFLRIDKQNNDKPHCKLVLLVQQQKTTTLIVVRVFYVTAKQERTLEFKASILNYFLS